MNSRNPHWLVQVLTFTILFTALLVVMFAFDSTATALSGSGLGFQAPAEDVPLAAAPSTAPREEPRFTMAGWEATHEQYVHEAIASAAAPLDLLFLGDSITEAWRGKDRGHACFGTRCDGVPEVWEKHFGHLRAKAFGIGGDRTEHLLWRLRHGEMGHMDPAVVVLLIGTNNLGAAAKDGADAIGAATEPTVRGIQAIVRLLAEQVPRAKLVVLGLLPRGSRSWDNNATAGGRNWIELRQPSIFTAAIDGVNRETQRWLASAPADAVFDSSFVDCSDVFLDPEGKTITGSLMNDGLHPNAQGYEAMLAQCLWPALRRAGVQPPNAKLLLPIAQWRRAVHDAGTEDASPTPQYSRKVHASGMKR